MNGTNCQMIVLMLVVRICFKNIIDISNKGGIYIDDKIIGISISQWLPCPLAIWNL